MKNLATAEAAALFYYLNRTGYNGLCRFNRRGRFNVPFGQYARITYMRDFSGYRDRLARWTFTSGDVEAVPLEQGDFIYADPPYDVEFTQYSARRILVGGPGANGGVGGRASGTNGAGESGHAKSRAPVPLARIRGEVREGAPPHQPNRRSNAGAGDHRDEKYLMADPHRRMRKSCRFCSPAAIVILMADFATSASSSVSYCSRGDKSVRAAR